MISISPCTAAQDWTTHLSNLLSFGGCRRDADVGGRWVMWVLVLEHFLYSWQRELVAVVVVFLTDLKVLETLAFARMQMMTAFLAKWLVSMVGGWTVERRATFYALHFVVLRGGWHVVLIFGMLFVIFFVIDFRFLIVDVFTSALVVIVFRFLIADVLTFAVVVISVAFLGIVRTEAFLANQVGRRAIHIEIWILSSFVESQDISVEFQQVVQKVELVAGLIICVQSWMTGEKGRGCAMLGFTSTPISLVTSATSWAAAIGWRLNTLYLLMRVSLQFLWWW